MMIIRQKRTKNEMNEKKHTAEENSPCSQRVSTHRMLHMDDTERVCVKILLATSSIASILNCQNTRMHLQKAGATTVHDAIRICMSHVQIDTRSSIEANDGRINRIG